MFHKNKWSNCKQQLMKIDVQDLIILIFSFLVVEGVVCPFNCSWNCVSFFSLIVLNFTGHRYMNMKSRFNSKYKVLKYMSIFMYKYYCNNIWRLSSDSIIMKYSIIVLDYKVLFHDNQHLKQQLLFLMIVLVDVFMLMMYDKE